MRVTSWLQAFALAMYALVLASAHAAEPAARELLAKVRERVQDAPVVRGGFDQLKTVKGFKQPLRSSGDFVVARGKGIVWHVLRPFESTLVVRPDSLQSRGSDGKLTMQMRAQDEPVLRTVNAMLFAVMSANPAELAQHFEVTGQVAVKGWSLHLVPRDPTLAQWLSAVELQGNQFVQEIRLQEARGDASVIRVLSPVAENVLRPQDAAQFE
ncbi:outer membrane lipoprotein carrier protein LolA [Acidovorax sp. 69]|uniref:outer membrane lipoprotein carrier protein LolA n=1 Tax=Acidovorax sp. 69 TaxID=2035202 RepID=UPI000C23FFE8|nr:outer membrane lipoprotein carrier protein LolA [Acidovorax sp. 69]PJI98645.1 outer membrane lipoprotein carrier protein LolA [Acidovorax sp. 69]